MNTHERSVVSAIIDRAFQVPALSISIFNGGDEPELKASRDKDAILAAMDQAGGDTMVMLVGGRRIGWISFIFGDYDQDTAEEVVCDYTYNAATTAIVGDEYE